VPQGSQPKAATARKVDTKSYNSTALADQSFCAKKLDWGDPVTEVLTLAPCEISDASMPPYFARRL
ncbi:hypothetical protein, partial [Yoonia sp. R2-816]|uniref:hypothetical protein n=1 Tax=Yoonia sp. R2-816 TaxID=3342638 RepID=UPI00372D2A6F